MERLKELLERKFLKDLELLELEDNDYVLECKFTKPYNAHYNEYEVLVKEENEIKVYYVYLKHR
jgi:hypothetical protein